MKTMAAFWLDCGKYLFLPFLCTLLSTCCKSNSNVFAFNAEKDTVVIKANKIEGRCYLNNSFRKEILFEIVDSNPVISGGDATAVYQQMNDLLNEVTLRKNIERYLKDVISPDYNPDLYVEVYKKERGVATFFTENDKIYDFFLDRKSGRGHFVVYRNKLLLSPIIEVGQDTGFIFMDYYKEMDTNNTVSESGKIFYESVRKISTIEEITSHNVFSTISEGSVSVALLLDPLNQQSGDKLKGNTIIGQNNNIPDNLEKEIKDALLSSESYKVSNVIVNATFLPDAALTIIKDNSEINVLFSFYSDVAKIFDGTDVFTLDITPSKKHWAAIFLSLFPDDEVLKRYQDE